MRIQTRDLVSMTEANQNFSKVARMVDKNGAAIILKNNTPKYILIDYQQFMNDDSEENVDVIARRVLKRNIDAFKELAK